MTSHCITWHDTTQAITSHQMTWPSHDLTPEQTSRHQNTSLQSTKHHHHGRAEGSFTAKKWFGHRAGRSPCAHSIGKFFLCYIVLFLLETSAPGLSGHYWYTACISCVDSMISKTTSKNMNQSPPRASHFLPNLITFAKGFVVRVGGQQCWPQAMTCSNLRKGRASIRGWSTRLPPWNLTKIHN